MIEIRTKASSNFFINLSCVRKREPEGPRLVVVDYFGPMQMILNGSDSRTMNGDPDECKNVATLTDVELCAAAVHPRELPVILEHVHEGVPENPDTVSVVLFAAPVATAVIHEPDCVPTAQLVPDPCVTVMFARCTASPFAFPLVT